MNQWWNPGGNMIASSVFRLKVDGRDTWTSLFCRAHCSMIKPQKRLDYTRVGASQAIGFVDEKIIAGHETNNEASLGSVQSYKTRHMQISSSMSRVREMDRTKALMPLQKPAPTTCSMARKQSTLPWWYMFSVIRFKMTAKILQRFWSIDIYFGYELQHSWHLQQWHWTYYNWLCAIFLAAIALLSKPRDTLK